MRISDWSSDVCSSDLILAGDRRSVARVDFVSPILDETTRLASVIAVIDNRAGQWRVGEPVTAAIQLAGSGPASLLVPQSAVQTVEGRRSEEHTSELQSLMRISYAVFCLKKKNKH